jgi:uncharacterized protein DUF6498
MRTVIARVGELLSTVGRQAVPLDGLFDKNWQAVTALAIYWFESLLLALVAVALCALLKRRSSERAAWTARRDGAENAARHMDAEREAFRKASINPKDVAVFHVGSLCVFGAFFTMLLIIMIGNHLIDQRFVWSEFRDGAIAMLIAVSVGFTIDLWRFPAMSVDAVAARVNACTARWGLFWILGFFGTGVMVFTGRAAFFLGVFAGLKLTWEVWATLARMFGWQSLQERQAMEARQAAGRGR